MLIDSMTIDLIAAGNRALETMDSQTDFENVLKILNHNNNLNLFKQNIDGANRELDKVVDYILNNNSFTAEVRHEPVTNGQPLHVDSGLPDDRTANMHDPLSMIKPTDSRIYKFSVFPSLALLMRPKRIHSFI